MKVSIIKEAQKIKKLCMEAKHRVLNSACSYRHETTRRGQVMGHIFL
jgi:hypothetical protein